MFLTDRIAVVCSRPVIVDGSDRTIRMMNETGCAGYKAVEKRYHYRRQVVAAQNTVVRR